MSEEPKIHQPPDYQVFDDMVDSADDLERWPKLAPVLQDCQATIVEDYHKADRDAGRFQTQHKRVVRVAAVCGMLAVLFAIMQLFSWALRHQPLLEANEWIVVAEIVAAVVAVFAVGYGVWASFSGNWLLEREKAERYRLLKFGFMIHPDRWNGVTSKERRKQLCDDVERVKTLDEKDLDGWARGKGEVLEAALPEETPADVDPTVLGELIDYYQEKRLNWQKNYCDKQVRERTFWGRPTRLAAHLLFFGSVGFALAHFLFDVVWRIRGEELNTVSLPLIISLTLILFAACFPVVGAAVRTLGAAHEYGRNTLRFEATSNELKQLASDLREKDDPWARLDILRVVERVLEVERREWLRLMKEAEWFG